MPARPKADVGAHDLDDISDNSLSFEIPTAPSATNLLDDTQDFFDGITDLNATFAPFKSSSPRKPFAPHNALPSTQQDQELKAPTPSKRFPSVPPESADPGDQPDAFVEIRRSPRKHKSSSIPSPVKPSSRRKTVAPPSGEEESPAPSAPEEHITELHPDELVSPPSLKNAAPPSIARPRPSSVFVDFGLPTPSAESEPAQAPEVNYPESPSVANRRSRSKSATPGRIPVPVSFSRRSSSATPTRIRTRTVSSNPVNLLETHAEESITESPNVSVAAHIPETIEEAPSSRPELENRRPDPPSEDVLSPAPACFSSPAREAPVRRLSYVRAKSEAPVPQASLYPSLPRDESLPLSPSRIKPPTHRRFSSLAVDAGISKPVFSSKPRYSSATLGHARTQSSPMRAFAQLEAPDEEQPLEAQESSGMQPEPVTNPASTAAANDDVGASKPTRRGSVVTERFRRYSQKVFSSFGKSRTPEPSALPPAEPAPATEVVVALGANPAPASAEVPASPVAAPVSPVHVPSTPEPREPSPILASHLPIDEPLSPLTPPPASPPMREHELTLEHVSEEVPASPSPVAAKNDEMVVQVPPPVEASPLRTSVKRRAPEDDDGAGALAQIEEVDLEMVTEEMEVEALAAPDVDDAGANVDAMQGPPSVPEEPAATLPAADASDPPKKRQRVKREHQPRASASVSPAKVKAKADTKTAVGAKTHPRPSVGKPSVDVKRTKPVSSSRTQAQPAKPSSTSGAAATIITKPSSTSRAQPTKPTSNHIPPPPASSPMLEQEVEPEQALERAPVLPSPEPAVSEVNTMETHVPSLPQSTEMSLRTSTKRRAPEEEEALSQVAPIAEVEEKAEVAAESDMELDVTTTFGVGNVDIDDADAQAPPSVPDEQAVAPPAVDVSDPPKERQRVKREHQPRTAPPAPAPKAKAGTKPVVGAKVDGRPQTSKTSVEVKRTKLVSTSRAQTQFTKPISTSAASTATTASTAKPTSTSRAQSTKPVSTSAAATTTAAAPRSRAPHSQGTIRTEARRAVPGSAASIGAKPPSKQKTSRMERVKKLEVPVAEAAPAPESAPALAVTPTAEVATEVMAPSASAPAVPAVVEKPEAEEVHSEVEDEQELMAQAAMDADVVPSSEGISGDAAETEALAPVPTDDAADVEAPAAVHNDNSVAAPVATKAKVEDRPTKKARTAHVAAPVHARPKSRMSASRAEKAAAAAEKAKMRARAKVQTKPDSTSEMAKPKSGFQPATVPAEFTFRMDAKPSAHTHHQGASGDAKPDWDINFNSNAESESNPCAGSSGAATTNSNPTRPRAPIPDFKALQAAHAASLAAKRPTVVPVYPTAAPNFKTVSRMKEREKFDALMRAHEEGKGRERAEERRKREEEEEKELREMRKRAVPKANEVPEWYKDVPKREKEQERGKGKEREMS
ncbi:hypothetical protein CONPUDRAFT_169823 [Coniophora puteana RWD-64-598 SS2]|uniref:TPX2 C-terminal domain-containing protein n=1 Tax=Coniophora puteana (strain RWD-64-598) TaxID=741705 RepID=A0A5M3M7U7_CONPW|nr:uncharacterized protein CONPUDRAFT_169823 [Coniophora puteana RWD-64-598 SS2]EIW74934.1 hypothetical protein CONPUDRAFT_169823 [Coniophora puteana RWD-64-598 SS2]